MGSDPMPDPIPGPGPAAGNVGSDPTLDHLVVVAASLEAGARWVEARLGVPMAGGGKHPAMGTHNRLLALGQRVFLEVMAIDPGAPAPARPRWFGLDSRPMREALAEGPALVHWVVRTEDINAALADAGEAIEILPLSRGEYRWLIGVPADGRLPGDGRQPTVIQWLDGKHPGDRLPASGCTLIDAATPPRPGGEARIRTPHGERTLPWSIVASRE